MKITNIRCEACGRNSEETSDITMEFSKDGEQLIACASCRRWITSGHLRKEMGPDGPQYRVWRYEIGPWVPTETVSPVVRQG